MKSAIVYDADEKVYLNVYTDEDGNICPYYILKGKIFKQAAAYIAMLKDINDCIEAIKYSILYRGNKTIPKIVQSSLIFNSIIKYSRLYAQGKGRASRLDYKYIFKGSPNQLEQFHLQTIELRNKYIAHTGKSPFENNTMIAILNPDTDNKCRRTITYAGKTLKDDDYNLEKYIELFEHVKNQINQKIEDLRIKINAVADEIDTEEMYDKSKLPMEEDFIKKEVNVINQ